MLDIRFKDRISVKQAVFTLIAALSLGLLLSTFQITIEYIEQRDQIEKQADAILQYASSPASQIAYNLDNELAEELVSGLLAYPVISHAEIVDNRGIPLAVAHRASTESNYEGLIKKLFAGSHHYSTDLRVSQAPDELLGHLQFVIDINLIGSNFLRISLITLVSGFITSLALAGILLAVSYRTVTKPLVHIAQAISDFDPSQPAKMKLTPPSGHENDEIGILVDSTNRQLGAIEGLLEKRRRDEERLTVYLEELENIVENRTAALTSSNEQLLRTNEQLRQAKEGAQRIAQARSEFLTNMSHEIRTPLNGVLGMIGLTIDTPLTDEQRHNLEIAHNSGIALLDILNDILDLSKFESGKYTLESIEFDLRQTAEEISSLLAQNAHSKHFEMTALVEPDFPDLVVGDPTRIRQIISNLAGNAVKFTKEGEVSIRISCEGEMGDKYVTKIEVADTGIGIATDALNKIFEPFSQATTATTREYGGTGIGLTLCRQLAEAMDGKIEVLSQEGEGSQFVVRLPLGKAPSAQAFEPDPGLQKASVVIATECVRDKHRNIFNLLKHWEVPAKLLEVEDASDARLREAITATAEDGRKRIIIVDDPSIAKPDADAKNQPEFVLMGSQSQLAHFPGADIAAFKHRMNVPIRRIALQNTLLKALGLRKDEKMAAEVRKRETDASQVRILLVEDNSVNQIVAKGMLKKIGYQVFIANNGQEAVKSIEHTSYDLVLMDCQMPVMDGFAATRAIRQMDKAKDLPIIALTANALKEDRARCKDAGMDDYLTKPYKQDALEATIEKWLHPAEEATESAAS